MLFVKFRSIYSEIDQFGNSRSFENSFEAHGDGEEVYSVVNTLLKSKMLPGTTPLKSLNEINRYLLDYKK